ncbi:hypothetical protein FRC00_003450 [Tulasnella sp. 408]|nr:hypothetical protein FRC00_003450 [Tulasnella sp. 408]
MPLPDETPFTIEEVFEVVELVNTVLTPINAFVSTLNGAIVAPDTFLQIPFWAERLQSLIDHFSIIHDLIPRPLFEDYLNSMLSARDQLLAAETRGPPLSGGENDGKLLFGTLQQEQGPNGGVRLELPRELVQSLIDDVGLTNEEIANVLGILAALKQGFTVQLVPGPLDDNEADVQVHAPDFTLYGADYRGAQQERRSTDPHVMFDSPALPFELTPDIWNYLQLAVSEIDEEKDFYGTAKYLATLHCIQKLCQNMNA